jgi:hypothetical protein
MDWSVFLDLLNQVRSSEKKSVAARPAFDVLLMFKIRNISAEFFVIVHG